METREKKRKKTLKKRHFATSITCVYVSEFVSFNPVNPEKWKNREKKMVELWSFEKLECTRALPAGPTSVANEN